MKVKATDKEIVAIMVLIPALFALGLVLGYQQGTIEHNKHWEVVVLK
jgi:hypothetical protein